MCVGSVTHSREENEMSKAAVYAAYLTAKAKGVPASPVIDIFIRDEGTVVAFTLSTEAAADWFNDHVEAEPYQWLGDTLYVDHRLATDLILGILNDTDLITN